MSPSGFQNLACVACPGRDFRDVASQAGLDNEQFVEIGSEIVGLDAMDAVYDTIFRLYLVGGIQGAMMEVGNGRFGECESCGRSEEVEVGSEGDLVQRRGGTKVKISSMKQL